MTSDWTDLSDDELAQRLVLRDVPYPIVEDWVAHRDDHRVARTINELLAW